MTLDFIISPLPFPNEIPSSSKIIPFDSFKFKFTYFFPGDDVGDSSIDDHQLLAYHFNIPDYLCGKSAHIERYIQFTNDAHYLHYLMHFINAMKTKLFTEFILNYNDDHCQCS